MNIPNSLTLLRIALIPIFVVVFYLPFTWANLAACFVFILAAVTDILDGYLARKLEQISPLGAFLDPVADKLMVAVVLLVLLLLLVLWPQQLPRQQPHSPPQQPYQEQQ